MFCFFDVKCYSHIEADGDDYDDDGFGIQDTIRIKKYSIQTWWGQITGHHFWLSHHRLQLHDDTSLNKQGDSEADKKREREINTQTQLDILIYYYYSYTINCYYYVIILDLNPFLKRKMKVSV